MKTVTFQGRELKLAHNIATEMAYCDITGKEDCSISEIFADGKTDTRLLMSLVAAMVIANNDTDITEHDITHCEDREDVTNLIKTATQVFIEWFTLPRMAEAHIETLPEGAEDYIPEHEDDGEEKKS